MPPKLFLDTNVWFSALYGSQNCKILLRANAKNKITAVLSHEVLTELIRNLRKKIPHILPKFEKMLAAFPPNIIADPEKVPQKLVGLADSKDIRIFAAAIDAKVDYFVTGNIKDFKVQQLEKVTRIKILTPKEAVRVLGLQK